MPPQKGKERDLARGPGKMTAAEKVEMEMRDGLPSVGPVIDDEAVTGLVELTLAGDLLGGGKEMAKNGMMFRRDGGMPSMVLLRDEQNVDRGLGGDIAEGDNMGILIDDVGFGLAVDDPFEDRFGHAPSLLPDGQFEELGTKVAGTGTDEMDNFVIQPLTGSPPGRGSGEGQHARPQAFQAKYRRKGSHFLVHNASQALEKDHLHGCFLGQGGQVDGG